METTIRKPAEQSSWATDRDQAVRPGVPMEAVPHRAAGAHWDRPESQRATVTVLKRPDLEGLTPVFGTAAPPRGVSGLLRRAAYRIPDHHASHWMLLLFADRVDVVESGIRERPWIAAAGAVCLGYLLWSNLRAHEPAERRMDPVP